MVLENILDYAKCLAANRVTLINAPLFMFSFYSLAALPHDSKYSEISFAAAVITSATLYLTGCGMHTYNTYRRVKKHIKKKGTLDQKFTAKISEWYCDQAGLRLAAKEAGLEDLLPRNKGRRFI